MSTIKLTEKLDLLLLESGLNRKQFSERSGIPYMTITNFYEKGAENVKLSTLKKISAFFEVSLDYIADDNVTEKNNVSDAKKAPPPEDESANLREREMLNGFRRLTAEQQDFILKALDAQGFESKK